MALLYTFYGDDFTGSTDVLEQLASNGVPAVLFLGVPTNEHLARFPQVQAVGIAGDSRSRSPEWMSEHLPDIFARLREFQAPVAHYKVCSTFDSAPAHGSIGRAMEIGQEVFGPTFVPIVVGAPHLRRYIAFGNLFASAPDGRVHRIDRHPMSRHPVTPMQEPDLRLHLARQTATPIGLIDTPMLQAGAAPEELARLLAEGKQAVLFDTIDYATQATVGKLLWGEAQRQPIFSTASSGLTAALIFAWQEARMIPQAAPAVAVEPCSPLLVVSGSCSAATERQLRYALSHGYHGIPLDPSALLDPVTSLATREAVIEEAEETLAAGRDTIFYTALGLPSEPAHGDQLGQALGDLLCELLERTAVRRVLLCGGDTSSHAVQRLGLYALTWAADLQPGAPLCRAHADSPLDGLELVLKGGQVGTDDFFDVVRGSSLRS
ncbi:four-carbon acid sugar kinase family protein [Granulicella sp. WH15]|uniref:four-carbon acid sugar kinase family protein n=1 Tax=Granulicella sp. WH15 TaxID=2602070 RepID=UPI001366F63D|nr:four-carbon acid sugar kinase family protein [Granulicella sp. WH15]QHN02965.1 four-carbon acid sugar kinase family protein [Granulicella sp. WH15]